MMVAASVLGSWLHHCGLPCLHGHLPFVSATRTLTLGQGHLEGLYLLTFAKTVLLRSLDKDTSGGVSDSP